MRTLFAAHKGRTRPLYLDEVLETSDVITLHSPLLPETRDMIDAEFRAMKRRPLLINTARGGLVSETDLVVALREGLISGAGFDVLTKEPPDEDQPLLELLEMPNFILTPHVAWASDEAMQGSPTSSSTTSIASFEASLEMWSRDMVFVAAEEVPPARRRRHVVIARPMPDLQTASRISHTTLQSLIATSDGTAKRKPLRTSISGVTIAGPT